jgi:hypothetical protein
MPGFTTLSLSSLGGALNDYSPAIDSTTDREAYGANQTYAAVSGMTHTAWRAWAQFTWNGTGAPTLVAHDAQWGNTALVAPTVARTGVGLGTITWAATQSDEITSPSADGYTGPTAINLRAATGNSEGGTTFYDVKAKVTAPNVVSFWLWSGASPPALVDPTGVTFDLWVM